MQRKRFAIFIEIGCNDFSKIRLGEERVWDAVTLAIREASSSYDYYMTNVSRTFEYEDGRTYDMDHDE